MDNIGPLDPRPYKLKRPSFKFFCPLCRTSRGFVYKSRLSFRNYIQIAFLCLFLVPLFGVRALFLFLFLAMAMDFSLRLLLKNEVPCPYCGFDAIWYKKDVKVARQKVKEFWQKKS